MRAMIPTGRGGFGKFEFKIFGAKFDKIPPMRAIWKNFSATALIAVFVLSCGASARADVYSCPDGKGGKTVTNVKKNSQCALLFRDQKKPGIKVNPKSPSVTVPTPSPKNFPRVNKATQRKRDLLRRQILRDEFDGEQRLVIQAEKNLRETLAADSADKKQIAALRRQLRRHQLNMTAIRQELQRLR